MHFSVKTRLNLVFSKQPLEEEEDAQCWHATNVREKYWIRDQNEGLMRP